MTREYSTRKVCMSTFIRNPADLVALIHLVHDALFQSCHLKKSEAVDALRNLPNMDHQLRLLRVYAHPQTKDIHFDFFHEHQKQFVSAYLCKVREEYHTIAGEEYRSVYLGHHRPSSFQESLNSAFCIGQHGNHQKTGDVGLQELCTQDRNRF